MEEEQWLRLDQKARIALMIKGFFGILLFVFIIGISGIGLILSEDVPLIYFVVFLAFILIIPLIIVVIWAIMFYNRYLFRIGDDAVYINRGILWKRNVVIPFERIQHTSITRGPIDLLLGLHILNIFTAGTGSVGARFGGTASAFAAEGSIPGLADPKPFQDVIMSRVKAFRGDGMGVRAPSTTGTVTAIQGVSDEPPPPDVQEEMLVELRKIRETLEKERR